LLADNQITVTSGVQQIKLLIWGRTQRHPVRTKCNQTQKKTSEYQFIDLYLHLTKVGIVGLSAAITNKDLYFGRRLVVALWKRRILHSMLCDAFVLHEAWAITQSTCSARRCRQVPSAPAKSTESLIMQHLTALCTSKSTARLAPAPTLMNLCYNSVG